MEKRIGQKIRLGIFVVAGLIFFAVAIYFIGNKQSLFGKTFTVNSVFRNVNGLQIGNNVRYSGINVGTVSKLEMMSDTAVLVEMRINEKIRQHMKKDVVATVGSDGLVGSMLINIIPGDGDPAILESGDFIKSYSRISGADMLSTLNVTNENAALLTADLLKITQAINEGQGTLGMLVKDPAMANDLIETIKNLKATSKKTVEFMEGLKFTLRNINSDETLAGMIINDSVTAAQFKNIIYDLQAFSKSINTSLDSIDNFIATINTVGTSIKTNEGTLNALVYDTLLANDLKQAVTNIKQGAHEFTEVMEAAKHSKLLRKYFGLEKSEKGK